MSKYFFYYFYIHFYFFIIIFIAGNWQNVGGDPAHSGYSEGSYVPLELVWKFEVGDSDISALSWIGEFCM